MDTIRKSGSTYPALKCSIPDYTAAELAAIDTVQLQITDPDGAENVEDCDLIDGEYFYKFPVDAEIPAGVYRLRLIVTFTDGYVEILPSGGEVRMQVEA